MTYSTKEVTEKLAISRDTLRYYEREGLFPPIKRNPAGHRTFTESDLEWIFLIQCLRDTDMPILKIKTYVSLLLKNDTNTISERKALLIEHQDFVHEKIKQYTYLFQLLGKKIEFYDYALLDENKPNCLDYEEEWEHFRKILGGMQNE